MSRNCTSCEGRWCSPKTERGARGRMVHPRGQGQYFVGVPINRCPERKPVKLKWERVDLTEGAQEVADQGARHSLLGS